MTPTATRLNRLEAVRGAAALYVMAHHLAPRQMPVAGIDIAVLFRFGQEAVIVFFLLSGFVIHHAYRARPVGVAKFAFNRIARLYIPLIAAFALSYVIAAASGATDPKWRELLGNVLMLQDYAGIKPGVLVEPYLKNWPLWSLSYEFWFYGLYLVLMKTLGDMRRGTFAVIAVAVVTALAYFAAPLWVLRILFYFAIWWSGALMAETYLSGRGFGWRAFIAAMAPVLATTAALAVSLSLFHTGAEVPSFGFHPVLEFRHFGAAIAVIVAAFLWHRLGWIGFGATLGLFAWAAPISYGVYIFHRPLMRVPELVGIDLRSAAGLALVIGATFALAWLVERIAYPPARNWCAARLFPRG